MNQKEFPEAIEMEKQLPSAMFMKEGLVVPEVAAIIDADDLYRPEHRLVFQAVLRLYAKKQPIDYLAVEEELRKTGDFGKIEHRYLLSLIDATFTTARAEYHAGIIKEKANFRKIIELGDIIIDEAQRGESCIFCSYEMSQLELFSKSLARKLFKRVPSTDLTAADIRRGAHSIQLANIINDFSNSKLNLSILELQDESIDELLSLLKPFCYDKAKAPVICLDYLQIVPSSKDSTKLGVNDSVRKLKKFQRDTNTTFIVISSFNRDNYTKPVSFESFKESGNIEYTADVVWALQLFVINSINSFNISDARQKTDKAKKQQPRQIQLKCLKNRQSTNYDCFFNYFSAHDCFIPCEKFSETSNDNDEQKKTLLPNAKTKTNLSNKRKTAKAVGGSSFPYFF